MSAQIKTVVAIAVLAGGAWWFWSQAGGARASRSPGSLPTPPASAARPAAPLAKAEMEAPTTAEELEAELRAEKTAEGGDGVDNGKRTDSEPSLALVEAYVPAPPIPPRPAEPGHIAGTIVDERGFPIKARTTLVGGEGGSYGGGNSGEDGGFDIERRGYETFQVKAWTRDGRVGLFNQSGLDASLGVSDAIIRLERGARVKLTLQGERDTCRIALFTNNVRHTDFTLRNDQTASEVVPVGVLSLELYNGSGAGKRVHDTRTVVLAAGQVEEFVFTVNE